MSPYIFISISLVLIPSIAVIIIARMVIKNFTNNSLQIQAQKNKIEKEKNTIEKIKATLPLKLQAYERIVMFLERIEPSSIVMRVHKPGMSAKLLHADLLKSVREEFEHNMSQQIYISSNAWDITKQAKEETIKLFNLATQKMEDSATGIDLSKAIFEMMMTLEKSPSNIAVEYLQKEVSQLIN